MFIRALLLLDIVIAVDQRYSSWLWLSSRAATPESSWSERGFLSVADVKGESEGMNQQRGEKMTKRKVVDMNYPPDDMSLEEQERFWGEPATEEELAEIEKARRSKLPNAKNRPRPV